MKELIAFCLKGAKADCLVLSSYQALLQLLHPPAPGEKKS